ncbi:MAG: hypothetical protein AABX03_00435 [Nanoarchaeota archaeon]
MKKKAILVPESMKLIIGVLVILMLFYLGFKLYGLLTEKSGIEQARAHMEKISSIVSNLKEGESVDYILLNPNGWHISVWPVKYEREMRSYDDKTSDVTTYFIEGKPKECENRNWNFCICLCEAKSNGDILKDCNSLGVCKEVKSSGVKINPEIDKEMNKEIFVSSLINEKKYLRFSLKNGRLEVSGGG